MGKAPTSKEWLGTGGGTPHSLITETGPIDPGRAHAQFAERGADARTLSNPVAGTTSTPAQITANRNNYFLGSETGNLRLSTDASRTITGLTGGSKGRLIYIDNVGSNDIVLTSEDTNSLAQNRFLLPGTSASLTLSTNDSVLLRYDYDSLRWRFVSSSARIDSAISAIKVLVSRGNAQTTADYTITSSDGTHAANDHLVDPASGPSLELTFTATGGLVIIEFTAELQHQATSFTNDNAPFIEVHSQAYIGTTKLTDYNDALSWELDVNAVGGGGAHDHDQDWVSIFQETSKTLKWYTTPAAGSVTIGIDVWAANFSDFDAGVVETGATLQIFELVDLADLL